VSDARLSPGPAAARRAALKKPSVSVFLGYPFYDEIVAAAATEPVKGPSAFIREVLAYGWQVYRRVRSLKALRELREEMETLSPGAALPQLAASKETYAELLAALGLILERAPSTVVEEVARLLTDRAGKYATARELPSAPAPAPEEKQPVHGHLRKNSSSARRTKSD
jgi:hypothetical protein